MSYLPLAPRHGKHNRHAADNDLTLPLQDLTDYSADAQTPDNIVYHLKSSCLLILSSKLYVTVFEWEKNLKVLVISYCYYAQFGVKTS